MSEKVSPQAQPTQIKVMWPVFPNVEPVFCNQFSVGMPGPEVVMDFAQMFVVGPGGRTTQEFMEAIGQPEVDVKARIILSRQGLKALAHLINVKVAEIEATERRTP